MQCGVAIILVFALCLVSGAETFNIIPKPRQITPKPVKFVIKDKVNIVVGKECIESTGEILAEDLKDMGVKAEEVASSFLKNIQNPIVMGIPAKDKNIADFLKTRKIEVPSLPEEGYLLEVGKDFIVVVGNDKDGVFWGMQTLRQMLKKGKGTVEVAGARIMDYPEMRWRGITDDVSRGPIPTLEYMKGIVRTLSAFKMNMYTPYIELHAFCFKSHPDMCPPGEGLDPEEMKELVAYAKRFNVDVFPSLQSFGHSDKLLRKPQYRHLAEIEDNPWSLSPAVEETYTLLKDLYNELAQIFPSPFFNINSDETYDLGQGKSKPIADEIGPGNLYLRHITRLYEMLKAKGKRVMFWGDIALHYKEMIPKLPKDIIVLNWDYGGAPSFDWRLEPFHSAGLEQFVCPGVSCWGRIFPDFENATVNINNFVRDGVKYKVKGMLNTTWDDTGENLFGYNWYAIVFSAEASWWGGNIDRADFDKRFDWAFFRSPTRIVEAINALSQASQPDSLFWMDPLEVLKKEGAVEQAKRIKELAERAISILENEGGKVEKNKGAIPYLLFAGHRLLFLADNILGMKEVEGLLEKPDKENLQRAGDILKDLYNRLYNLREEYKALWLSENIPFFLSNNIQKYDNLLRYLEEKRKEVARLREG